MIETETRIREHPNTAAESQPETVAEQSIAEPETDWTEAQDNGKKHINTLLGWAKLIAAIGGAIAVVWTAVLLFNPIGKTDISIVIEREIQASLPTDISHLPIRMSYEGRDIARASNRSTSGT